MTGFGSAQDESLDFRWGEHCDFDCARSADRVPHHYNRTVTDSVERREGPRSEVSSFAVQRRSDAVIDERPQAVGEDRCVQRERMQQKQLHVPIVADSLIRRWSRNCLVSRLGRGAAQPFPFPRGSERTK